MLRKERENLTNLAMEQVSGLFKTQPGAFYQDSVQHKLNMLLQAIDRAAIAVDKPILFAELVPGFDLVILRNPEKTCLDQSEKFDGRAMSAVDESCLLLFGRALTKLFETRRAAGEEEQGAYIFQGGDGLHYFGFKTSDRYAILKEMGVSGNDLVNFVPGSGVMQ